MPYASAAEFETALGAGEFRKVADRDRDGTPDLAAVEAALEEASAEADGYIRNHLPLPGDVPSMLRRVVITIAHHEMAQTPSEHLVRRYTNGLRWLRDVSNGVVSLAAPPPGTPESDDPIHYRARRPFVDRDGGLF